MWKFCDFKTGFPALNIGEQFMTTIVYGKMKIEIALLIVLVIFWSPTRAQRKISGLFNIPFGTTKSEVTVRAETKGFVRDTSMTPKPEYLDYSIKTEEGYWARVAFIFDKNLFSSAFVEYEVSNKTLAFFGIKQRLSEDYGTPNLIDKENECTWITDFGQNAFGVLTLKNDKELTLVCMFTTTKTKPYLE